MYRTFVLLTMGAVCAMAQKLDLSALDKLRDKAEESANVDIDREKLGLFRSLLSSDKAEQRGAKDFISALTGIYVRNFEFASAGAYAKSDLDPILKQLKGVGWSRIVDVKGKEETVEIYVHNPGKPDQGMVIIATQPRELSVVNIVGASDLSKLGALEGLADIPNLSGSSGRKQQDKKDDE